MSTSNVSVINDISVYEQILVDVLDMYKYNPSSPEPIELISKSYSAIYKDAKEFKNSTQNDFDKFASNSAKERRKIEKNYYNYILSGLKHNLGEMKYYSNVDVSNSRRIIFTNNDCISMIHILIRDKIYLNVYMRSSNFSEALLGDLEFFGSIIDDLIEHFEENKNSDGFDEINDDYIKILNEKKIQFNITFGSLHTNA